MSGVIFPASPNWYCSRVSDCNESGKLVFASHNKAQVADFSNGDLRFSGSSWETHVEKCCSLSLCQLEGFFNLCCTAGDDDLVRVWDIETKSLLHEYDGYREKVTVVHWSPVDPNLILFGDDKGTIVSWKPKARTEDSVIHTPEKASVSALTCSPHDGWHVAIGYKNGLVIVFDLHHAGTTLHRLRGHDEEVLSIAWCPVLGEKDPDKNVADGKTSDMGCLIASGSRDRTIRLWSTTTGHQSQMFTLPTNTGHRRERFDDTGRARAWVTVNWPKQMPRNLLSSSHGGELLIWDIWKKSKQKWRVVETQGIRSHWRSIFNISIARNFCFTISLDRQLGMWDLTDLKCVATRTTVGGFIYTIVNSPVNPGNLAIGAGDQIIRLWNVSQPEHLNKVTCMWQGIKSKVTALCWHPVQENVLAYGTDDGRVGIYDAIKPKPPVMAHTFHKTTVYSLTFGPPCSAPGTPVFKTSHALYSCGDYIINMHNPSRLDAKAININEIIMKTNESKHCLKRCEMRWKLDQSVAAIGNNDGSVEIVSAPNLKVLCVIHSTKRPINTIQWHPEYTTDCEKEQSKLHTWIAIGSNDPSVHVVDWEKSVADMDPSRHLTITESTRVLTGHSAKVTCLAWSVHRQGLLASASFDKSVQVWNVLTNEPIGNYRGHNGYLLTVLWHPLEDDVVISGAEDFSVHSWKPSQLVDKLPPPKGSEVDGDRQKRKKKKKGKGKARSAALEQSPATAPMDEESKNELMAMLEQKRLEIMQAGNGQRDESVDVDSRADIDGSSQCSETETSGKHDSLSAVSENVNATLDGATADLDAGDAALLGERKMKLSQILGMKVEQGAEEPNEVLPKRDMRNVKLKRRRLLFPLGNELENTGKLKLIEDCVNIAYLLSGSPPSEVKALAESGKLAHLGTFLDKNTLYKMVTLESEYHLSQGHLESYFTLEIWKGNIAEMLKKSEECNQLSDLHIAMASYSQHPTFLATCEAYARQLEKCDYFMKATCYYLVSFKVYEAVDMLVKNKLFKEAVVLARLRLPSSDPKIQEAFVAWADYLINEVRTPEQAAKCYLTMGNTEEAMKLLARRHDIVGYKNASNIAFTFQKDELGVEYSRKMSHLCLHNYDWNTMNEQIERQSDLRDMILLGALHKTLCHQLKKLGLLDPTLQQCEETETIPNGDKPALPEIFLNADVGDSMIPWQPVMIGRQSFLHNVLKTWYYKCGLKMEKATISEIYDKMSNAKPAIAELAHLSYRQALVHVSGDISMVILALLLGEKTAALKHMLDAMVTCYDHKLDKLLQGICNIVLPLGPEYISRFFQEVQAVKVAARFDGSIRSAAGSSIAEIGEQEVQQEAITAYYCWSVVKYALKNLETDECKKEAGNKSGSGDAGERADEGGAGSNVREGNGGGDASKSAETEEDKPPDAGSQSYATDGKKILDYITGIRIDTLFQVLLHKVQSRRFMCTEKLAYIESAIKVVRERTKDEETVSTQDDSTTITLPPITPRTPIPSVCIDDSEPESPRVHEPSPEHVELKISTSANGDANTDSMQVVFKKTSPEISLGTPSQTAERNGVKSESPGNVLSSSSCLGSNLVGPEGLNQLSPFSSPIKSDEPGVGTSPEVLADSDDYVEMDKLRAWAAARKRQSDFALMMFKDSFSYDNVPSEWYQMPASEKYTEECVTMDILVNEKAQVSKQLEEVAFFVKDAPYPNTHQSSKVLLDICQNLRSIHRKDVNSYIEAITAWIKENGVTREHYNWIEQKP